MRAALVAYDSELSCRRRTHKDDPTPEANCASCGGGSSFELCDTELDGCPCVMPSEDWVFAERAIRSIETGHLPAAGGLEDQSEQYRVAVQVLTRAKHEIQDHLRKVAEKRAQHAQKRAARGR